MRRKIVYKIFSKDAKAMEATSMSLNNTKHQIEEAEKNLKNLQKAIKDGENSLAQTKNDKELIEQQILKLKKDKEIAQNEAAKAGNDLSTLKDMKDALDAKSKAQEASIKEAINAKNLQLCELTEQSLKRDNEFAEKQKSLVTLLNDYDNQIQAKENALRKQTEKFKVQSDAILEGENTLSKIEAEIKRKIEMEHDKQEVLDNLEKKYQELSDPFKAKALEICKLDAQIADKKKEIENQETMNTAQKELMLSLVKREERLGVLTKKVKDLYAKAGLEVTI